MLNTFFKLYTYTRKSLENVMDEYINKTVSHLAQQLIYKLIFGLILASAVVYSFFHFAQLMSQYFAQYENELTFGLIGFGSVILIGTMGLYYLFNEKKVESNMQPKMEPLDRRLVAMWVVEGFIQGYGTNQQSPRIEHRL